MPRFDASVGECLVFTFKEGLLSRIAHDLKIRVERFSVEVDLDDASVAAELDAKSMRVVDAMKDGREAPGLLSPSDKRKIEDTLATDVLHLSRHPTIRFRSTGIEPRGKGYRVDGELELHGRSRAVAFDARPEGDRLVAELVLHQPDWGITPYKAAFGTLRLKPDVRIRMTLPAASMESP